MANYGTFNLCFKAKTITETQKYRYVIPDGNDTRFKERIRN